MSLKKAALSEKEEVRVKIHRGEAHALWLAEKSFLVPASRPRGLRQAVTETGTEANETPAW